MAFFDRLRPTPAKARVWRVRMVTPKTKHTMSTKHTPGPWKTECGQVFNSTASGWVSEYVAKVNEVSKCSEANARLIAAAPELLEALEWAVKLMSGEAVPAGCEQAARAAISKAKGQQ